MTSTPIVPGEQTSSKQSLKELFGGSRGGKGEGREGDKAGINETSEPESTGKRSVNLTLVMISASAFLGIAGSTYWLVRKKRRLLREEEESLADSSPSDQ